jgi:putative solute:sodium symporter small subunit
MEKQQTGEKTKLLRKKQSLVLLCFLIYFVVYGGFIGIGVFKPELMGMDVGSLNLALVYGLGLIIFALILAFIYNAKCTKMEKEAEDEKDGDA